MKCYLYDFDGTIYNGDSSIDFLKYILKKYPKLIVLMPKIILAFIKYKFKLINKVKFKSIYFSFLKKVKMDEKIVDDFWSLNDYKIKDFWKKKKKHSSDIIISASPEFILEPIKRKYKVLNVIATKIDINTGSLIGKNCFGEEKVTRLFSKYPDLIILESYSDSMNDLPILRLGQKAFLVNRNRITQIDFSNRRD